MTVLKVERKLFPENNIPAFLITIDTEIPADTDYEEVLVEAEYGLPFEYISQDISSAEAIEAANKYRSRKTIPTDGYINTEHEKNLRRAGKYLFDHEDDDTFIIVGLDSAFRSSMGTWLVSVWAIGLQQKQAWHL